MQIRINNFNIDNDNEDFEYNNQARDLNASGIQFAKKGIHIKKENKGSFTSYCGGKVTDECIQRAKHSSSSAIRKKAVFADNARHWAKKHQSGGEIEQYMPNSKQDLSSLFTTYQAPIPSTFEKSKIEQSTFKALPSLIDLSTPKEVAQGMFYGNAFGNLTTAYTNKTYLRGSVNSATETALAESINGLMNIPYVWGGSSKKGTDCSGFTQQVYKNLGVNLPRTSGEQYKSTTRVNSSELQYGDLVFLQGTAGKKKGQTSHVAVFEGYDENGNLKVAEAAGKGSNTKHSTWDISKGFYKDHWLGAGRVFVAKRGGVLRFDAGGYMPGSERDYSSLFVKYGGTSSKSETPSDSYTTPELPKLINLQETTQETDNTEHKAVKSGLAALTSEYLGNYNSGGISYTALTSGGKELVSTLRRVGSYEDSESGRKQFIKDMDVALQKAGVKNESLRTVIIAQDALESGYGAKSLGGGDYNYGNLTTGKNWGGNYRVARDRNAKGDWITQKFRSYSSLDEYISDKLKFIGPNSHYKVDFDNDDAKTYINKIVAGHYAEDPNYRKALNSMVASIEKRKS